MSTYGETTLEVVRFDKIHFLKVFLNGLYYRSSHTHEVLEIALLCEGKLSAFGKGMDEFLEPGDILICNPMQAHELHSIGGESKLLIFQLSQEWLRFFGIDRIWFDKNSLKGKSHSGLSTALLSLAEEYYLHKTPRTFYCQKLVSETVDYLMEQLPYHFSKPRDYLSGSRSERDVEMLNYIVI